MMALWSALKGSKFVVYLSMAFAAVMGALGLYLKGKGAGKAQAKAKAQEKTLENVSKAEKASRDVASADPVERARLRKRYTRK